MKTMMKPVCALVILTSASFSAYADSRAEEAKKAFDTLISKTQAVNERYQKWPFFDKMSVEVTDYKAGEDSSTATAVSEVAMKKAPAIEKSGGKVTSTSTMTITHTQALADKGIVARVETKVDKVNSDLDDEASQAANKEVEAFSDKMTNVTDIYKDGRVHVRVSMKAIKDDNTDMKGFVANWHTTLDDMEKMYGTLDGEFKGAADIDESNEMQPFTFKGKYDKSGKFNFSTTPIVLKEKDKTVAEIKKISLSGKILEVNSLDFDLASATFALDGVTLNDPSNLPVPVSFEQLQFAFTATPNKNDSVSVGLSTHIAPSGDWVKKLSQEAFDLSKADLSASFDNIPVEILNKLKAYVGKSVEATYKGEDQEALQEEMTAELEKDLQKWGDLAEKSHFGPAVLIDIDSDKGKIFADAKIHMKPNDVDLDKLKDGELSPEVILSMLDISAKSSLPASLVEQLQLQMMLAMAFQKKDDKYVADIKTEDNKLLINDIPFDFSQLSE